MRKCFWPVSLMAVLSAGMTFGTVTVTTETSSKNVKYTVVTGEAGDVIAVADYGNTDKTIYRPGAGGTVKLTPGEAAAFKAVVDARKIDGEVSVAVDTDEPIDELRWQGHVCTKGPLTVTGAKKVVFGGTDTGDSSAISFALFYPGEWPSTNPEVVFTNSVTLARNPSSAWSIAAGTMVGAMKDARLGVSGEEYVIGKGAGEHDHDLIIAGDKVIAASALRIKPGVDVGLRYCGLSDSSTEFWSWGGNSREYQMPFVLDGATAELKFPASNTHTLSGSISGDGFISSSGKAESLVLSGDLSSFTGYVKPTTSNPDATRGQTICVDGDYIHDVRLITKARTTSFSMRPEGYKAAVPTAGRVDSLSGNSDLSNKVWVVANNTLTVGSLSGKIQINGDATAKVVVESLAANALVRLVGGVALQVNQAGAGAQVVLGADVDTEPGAWRLFGPESGTAQKLAVSQVVAGGTLAVGGQLDLGSMKADFATLTLLPGKLVASVWNETKTLYQGGELERTMVPWQEKVALWCDADCPESFVYCKDCNSELSKLADNQIFWWHDRRPEQVDYCLAMSRFKTNETASVDKYPAMYPKVVAESLNGKPCVSLASSPQCRMGVLAKATALNNQNKDQHVRIPSKFAIVVGRSNSTSDGTALLCTYDGRLDASKRGSDAYVFTNETLIVRKNGELINQTATKWGSDWAIYSFTTDDALVNGITTSQDPHDNQSGGGFQYAEILVFAAEPTETERKQIEEYLSAKWGIVVPHADARNEVDIGGTGRFNLMEDTVLRGTFDGTVDLGGRKLTLTGGKLPYTDADIPTDKQQFWFDPTVDGAVHMGGDAAKPDEIKEILPRDADGRVVTEGGAYLQSAIGEDGSADRRPRLAEGSRGGVASKWIDFADGYADGVGNNLMFRNLPVAEPLALYTDSGWDSVYYKTIFVVTDTSRGGGTPFGHYAGMTSGDIQNRGVNAAYGDPIWKTGDKPGTNGCMPIITNGQTWLDGVAVDGTTHGFSGRPEVMSFMPANQGGTNGKSTTQVKGIACPTDASKTVLQKELLGEIIAYNRYLTDEERMGVETYLMGKWLGKLPEGYVDFRNMTVTGAGELVLPTAAGMPKLGADFTGSVSVTTNELAFSFAEDATQATDVLDVGEHTLALPATVTVNLTFASRVKGDQPYVIMKGALQSETKFVLGTVTGGGSHAAEGAFAYDAEAKTVTYTVPKAGAVLILR